MFLISASALLRSIDTVDNTMDQIREQMDIATEISDAIAQPLGDPIDEDELEAELAELEAENLDEQLLTLNTPTTVSASPIKRTFFRVILCLHLQQV